MRMLVAAVMLVGVLAGCGSTPPPAPTSPAADPGKTYDEVNAPIAVLTELRQHCFRTGVEAATAQLRAATFLEKDQAAKKAEYEKAGELLPAGFPLTVSEVDDYGICYMVRNHGYL
ncbi:hypothetical protein [Mycobacteroides chelonae]|uniref:hypothetical protein n=1 Tax=Mycobacteroides chelonae TaxID=1774 RepID=UPI000F4EF320|nr:hypothetical protein [Mycobacteroides chelonae]